MGQAEIERAQRVVDNPDDFTGRQVRKAEGIIRSLASQSQEEEVPSRWRIIMSYILDMVIKRLSEDSNKGCHIIPPYMGSIQSSSTSPVSNMADSDSRTSLKDAEDKVIKWLSDQGDKQEGIKAIVYKYLYNEGLRINSVEQTIRKYFK